MASETLTEEERCFLIEAAFNLEASAARIGREAEEHARTVGKSALAKVGIDARDVQDWIRDNY